jgi:large subunit ribosomal protein L5
VNPDQFTRPQGMNITIVTSSNNNDEARDLLKLFGMPFKQDKKKTEAA